MNTATLVNPASIPYTPNGLASIGPASTEELVLTADQQEALTKIFQFLVNPVEQVFVLEGYSGCGKSTLVRRLLDQLPTYMKTAKLIAPKLPDLEVQLTATTNKAAENLAQLTGMNAITIHSFLGMRVVTDYKTNTTKLVLRNEDPMQNYLLFVDEASYIDSELLGNIFKKMKNSKVIFVGDPAQLIAVNASSAPVFKTKFPGAALTQVVRQANGNPIVDLAIMFRDTVNGGDWPQFTPDGHFVRYLERDAFNEKILQEFTRPGWRYKDSKVLTWTNKRAIEYNNYIRSHTKGDPDFQVDDYAVCNSFLSIGRDTVKTDQLVRISGISEDETQFGVLGNMFTLEDRITAFMPKTLAGRIEAAKRAKAQEDYKWMQAIDQRWVDLRAAYAQTLNKSQGSTYGCVFIDLDDVSKCTVGDQIARMLYVGVSRAKDHVYLTGDLA